MSRGAWIALAVVVMILASRKLAFAVKPGALISTRPEIEYARRVLTRVWAGRGYQLTITSGWDGTHGADSLHDQGLAEDYRTRDVAASDLTIMIGEARAILGADYDVVQESDHLHVEFDPS